MHCFHYLIVINNVSVCAQSKSFKYQHLFSTYLQQIPESESYGRFNFLKILPTLAKLAALGPALMPDFRQVTSEPDVQSMSVMPANS